MNLSQRDKPAISGQVFRLLIVSKKLIQQLRCNRRIGRHVSLLDKVNSQKPAYTFFRTPSPPVADASRGSLSPVSSSAYHHPSGRLPGGVRRRPRRQRLTT